MSRTSLAIFLLAILFIILLAFKTGGKENSQTEADYAYFKVKTEEIPECKLNEDYIVNFSEAKYIANGQQGFVYKFRNNVLKTQEFDLLNERRNIKMFENEIQILRVFNNSQDIVGLKNACYKKHEDKIQYYILMEYCEEEFEDWLSQQPKTASAFYDLLIHISKILLNINQQNIYHVDNHIGNLMICGNKLKLIDFGSGAITKNNKNNYAFAEIRNLQILFNDIAKNFSIRNNELNDLLAEMRKIGIYKKTAPIPKLTMRDVYERLIIQKNKILSNNKNSSMVKNSLFRMEPPLFVGASNNIYKLTRK